MKHRYPACISFIFTMLGHFLSAQEPESFSRGDFQLLGPVRTCVVKANYGAETFEFDRSGRLVKSQTRYNDADYDITHYRFSDSLLTERRDEVYRDGKFDAQTSIAHFYSRDTAAQPRLMEHIVSYDRSFQEQVAYYYDDSGRLERIVRTDAEGVDETLVEYAVFKNESTRSFTKNGQLHKSIRTSQTQGEQGGATTQLVKEYLGGSPVKAVESTLDKQGRLLREVTFAYDEEKKSFVPVKTREISYNDRDLPETETTTLHATGQGGSQGERKEIRNYVYQLDGSDHGNWVRQIITPENAFVVRQITYFKPSGAPVDQDSLND